LNQEQLNFRLLGIQVMPTNGNEKKIIKKYIKGQLEEISEAYKA